MFSKFERQHDSRPYDQRTKLFTGPNYVMPVVAIKPAKSIVWNEDTGMPSYVDKEGNHVDKEGNPVQNGITEDSETPETAEETVEE